MGIRVLVMAVEFLMVTSQKRYLSHNGISPEKVWGDVRYIHVGYFEPRDERTPQRTLDRAAIH